MKITHMTKMTKIYCGNETNGDQARICCLNNIFSSRSTSSLREEK